MGACLLRQRRIGRAGYGCLPGLGFEGSSRLLGLGPGVADAFKVSLFVAELANCVDRCTSVRLVLASATETTESSMSRRLLRLLMLRRISVALRRIGALGLTLGAGFPLLPPFWVWAKLARLEEPLSISFFWFCAISQASAAAYRVCLLYTSPSPRDKRQSRMPSSA